MCIRICVLCVPLGSRCLTVFINFCSITLLPIIALLMNTARRIYRSAMLLSSSSYVLITRFKRDTSTLISFNFDVSRDRCTCVNLCCVDEDEDEDDDDDDADGVSECVRRVV